MIIPPYLPHDDLDHDNGTLRSINEVGRKSCLHFNVLTFPIESSTLSCQEKEQVLGWH